MPVLFISHSSKDDAHANALAAWLRANGFTDFFIDHQKNVFKQFVDAIKAAYETGTYIIDDKSKRRLRIVSREVV
jgi:hypothetical protein